MVSTKLRTLLYTIPDHRITQNLFRNQIVPLMQTFTHVDFESSSGRTIFGFNGRFSIISSQT